MDISQWQAVSWTLPKGIRAEKVKRIIQESFSLLPLEIISCNIKKRTIVHNSKCEHDRICAVSVAYPELREIEDVFADIAKLDEVGLDFSHSHPLTIHAVIPEIHPTVFCSVNQSWGRVDDDHPDQKPPDSVYAQVELWGEILFASERKALQETGADIFEPKEIKPGIYKTEWPGGGVSGPCPHIRIIKTWNTFDMRVAKDFVLLIKSIDKDHCITYPSELTYQQDFAKEGMDAQAWQRWVDTRYPSAVINGYFFRDARNGPYWRVYHVSQFVHYDPDDTPAVS